MQKRTEKERKGVRSERRGSRKRERGTAAEIEERRRGKGELDNNSEVDLIYDSRVEIRSEIERNRCEKRSEKAVSG